MEEARLSIFTLIEVELIQIHNYYMSAGANLTVMEVAA